MPTTPNRSRSNGQMRDDGAHERGEESGPKKKKTVTRTLTKTHPYPMRGGSFIDRLEKHKQIGNSFDDGTWKPRYKGQSFIDALEEHKKASYGEFM